MSDYEALQKQVDKLIELAQQAEATGETGKPGDVSSKASAWVNEAITQLWQITRNIQDTLDTRLSAKPSEISQQLLQIAENIENSNQPQRGLVVKAIQRVVKSIGG